MSASEIKLQALRHYELIRALARKQLDRRQDESMIWNLSGSTMVHVLVILGLGFYISIPQANQLRHTISVNLNTISELSTETQIGQGAEVEHAAGAVPEQRRKKIVHTTQPNAQFDSGAFLLAQQQLLREIEENRKALEETERIGFLGVYDVHPAYQQYQQYWQKYVSRYGTENYPLELVRDGLSGSLELDIAIDKQGVVRGTDIHRSSGNVKIDNAAIEIAMLASPYDPLPEEMAKDIDVLHIIRTWEFNNNTLVSRPEE